MTRPNLPPQPPLSREQADQADQLAIFVERTRQNIEKAVEAIELRKWCIEKAIQATNRDGATPAFASDTAGRKEQLTVQFACVALARDVHDFVTEPLTSALDGLEKAAKEKDR